MPGNSAKGVMIDKHVSKSYFSQIEAVDSAKRWHRFTFAVI